MKYQLSQPLSIHELGQRQNQEDSIYPLHGVATANDRLFLLCDGMGGHDCGEVASRIVCQEVSTFIHQTSNPNRAYSDEMVRAAMENMYNVLDANDTGGDKKMGTTMVMLYFQPGGVIAGHVGDSRYYHIRPATHKIMYRSKDHSLVTQLYEAGEIKRSEMATAPGKNIILRAVMPHQESLEMPDLVHIKDVQPGDWFYMCSDGMLEQMSDEEILSIFCDPNLTAEQKRDCLLAATRDNRDNHTAYLIEVQGVEHDAIDAAAIDDEQEARMANKMLMAMEFGDEAVEQTAQHVEMTASTNADAPLVAVAEEAIAPQRSAPQPAQQAQPRPAVHSASAPSNKNSGNGKLYVIIGVLVALIALLLAGFFMLNNKKEKQPETEKKPTEIPTRGSNDFEVISPANHSERIESPEKSKPSPDKNKRVTSPTNTSTEPSTKGSGSSTGNEEEDGGNSKIIVILPGNSPTPGQKGDDNDNVDPSKIGSKNEPTTNNSGIRSGAGTKGKRGSSN